MKRYLATILLAIALLITGCSSSKPATLRVMSYNIHIAKGMDKKLDIERIAKVINEAKPDLVAVQEVDRGAKRTEGMDQPARLAELTGMKVVFGNNLDRDGGQYGIAVLSRLPIESDKHYLLPRFGNNEQRGLIETHVKVEGRPLVFFATHLDHQQDDAERLASMKMIRELIEKQAGKPVILAGDFNAEPDSPVMSAALEFLNDGFERRDMNTLTFPADKPEIRIDYILCNRNAGLRARQCWIVPEAVASDHRPIVVTFELDGE